MFFLFSRVSVIRQYSFSIYYLWLETISPSWISCIYVSKKFLATAFLIKHILAPSMQIVGLTSWFLVCQGFVCLQTLPFLYNKYEDEVDKYAGKLIRRAKKMFKRFDSSVLNKIPRGPAKEKKTRWNAISFHRRWKCVNKKVLGLINLYVCLWKFVIIDLQSWFLV